MFKGETGTVAMSERDELWPFYYREFTLSPIVGRGIGAGFVASRDWLPGLTAPHNEYLHFLVIGGVVGFVLIVGGIGLWYRHLLQIASPDDRPCLLALIPAVAVYIFTDNLSFYTTALPLYAYLSVLLIRPSLVPMVAADPPESQSVSTERLAEARIRGALARMRANSEAVERLTSRRSR
jgi:O-antigen ligase